MAAVATTVWDLIDTVMLLRRCAGGRYYRLQNEEAKRLKYKETFINGVNDPLRCTTSHFFRGKIAKTPTTRRTSLPLARSASSEAPSVRTRRAGGPFRAHLCETLWASNNFSSSLSYPKFALIFPHSPAEIQIFKFATSACAIAQDCSCHMLQHHGVIGPGSRPTGGGGEGEIPHFKCSDSKTDDVPHCLCHLSIFLQER